MKTKFWGLLLKVQVLEEEQKAESNLENNKGLRQPYKLQRIISIFSHIYTHIIKSLLVKLKNIYTKNLIQSKEKLKWLAV